MNLLGSAAYDPAAAVSKATSSLLAMTAVDTTNLRLAITVPAHGKVLFRLKCNIAGATTMPAILLGVMNGATVLKRQVPAMNTDTQSLATQNAYAWAEFIATGLAPGAMNVDAAYAVQVVVAATNIKYGGPDSNAGANAWGAFVFEAWDPQPIPTVAPGAAGGLLIAGANAATTFASLTSTAAFSVNGVNNVSQTGDSFARIGAPVGASISADIAAVKTDTAAVKVQTDKLTFTVANQIDANVLDWKSATAPAMTGDAFARLGAPVGASTSADIAAVQADTDNIQTRLPTTLVSGRIDCSVGAMAANVLTATAINADAITDAKVAADVTIASVTGAVGSVTGAVTVGTNNDKTGYALSAAGVQAIWDALTSALTTVGSIGKLIVTNLDALISSRASPTNITAGTITTVTNLTNAPTAGDFTAVMKTSLNAATPAVTVSDKTGFSLSAGGVQAIWDALTSALTTVGSIGKRLADNVDAAITSRLATVGYTAPDNADIVLIKAKTDGLPPDPADASDIAAAFSVVGGAISGLNNISPAGVRAAVGLASANLDTQLDALPTNAELTTALAGADDATLAAIAALSIPTKIAIADEVATRTLNANVKKINDVTLQGDGAATKWGP